MTPILDIRTLSVATGFVALFFSIPFLSLMLGRKALPGAVHWTIGLISAFLGLVLLGLRGRIPGFISVTFGNLFLQADGVLVIQALKAFVHEKQTFRLDTGILILATAAIQLFDSVWPDSAARIVVFSGVSAVFMTRAFLVVARRFPNAIRHQKGILIVTFGFYVLWHAARAALALLYVRPGEDFLFSGSAYQAVTFVVAIGWIVISTTTFVVAMTRSLQQELSEAEHELQMLSGLLPICANCKRIRNDDGTWTSLERYISVRSSVTFSHGVCPECAGKLYPGIKIEKT